MLGADGDIFRYGENLDLADVARSCAALALVMLRLLIAAY